MSQLSYGNNPEHVEGSITSVIGQGTHLWCGPGEGESVHAIGQVRIAEDVGETNIADLGSSVTCEQHVGGLEVEVDDAMAMQEVQPASDLQRYPASPGPMHKHPSAAFRAFQKYMA